MKWDISLGSDGIASPPISEVHPHALFTNTVAVTRLAAGVFFCELMTPHAMGAVGVAIHYLPGYIFPRSAQAAS
jgi:hypothetical protein